MVKTVPKRTKQIQKGHVKFFVSAGTHGSVPFVERDRIFLDTLEKRIFLDPFPERSPSVPVQIQFNRTHIVPER